MADPPSRPAPRWSWCGPVWDGRGGCASGRRPPVHVRGEVPHRVQLVIAHAVEQCVDLAADGARPGCGGVGLPALLVLDLAQALRFGLALGPGLGFRRFLLPALLGGNGVLLALEFGAFGSDTGFLCGALLADQALFLLELAPLFGQAFGFDALRLCNTSALLCFKPFPFGTFRGDTVPLRLLGCGDLGALLRGDPFLLGAQAGEFFAFGPEAGGFGFTGA